MAPTRTFSEAHARCGGDRVQIWLRCGARRTYAPKSVAFAPRQKQRHWFRARAPCAGFSTPAL
eukprot:11371793-Alexandrium_andersonii.AAC.1